MTFIHALLIFLNGGFARATETKTLVLGDEWSVRAPRVWVGSEGVLSVRPGGAGVVIKGRKVGVTDLKLGDRSLVVRIVRPGAVRLFDVLSERSRSRVGLETDWNGTVPAVTGRLHRVDDYLKLADKLPAGEWEFRAEVPERLRDGLENALKARLGPEAPVAPLLYEETPVSLFNGTAEAAARWEGKLASWGLKLRRDDGAVEIAPVVRVEIAVAEIRRARAKNLGVRWPDAISGQILPDGAWVREGLPFNAQAFESEGLGRLLARPNLLCRSGKEAEFMAGGEFPIKTFNYLKQDVVWKKYGILLKVKPKADASGRIALAVETEVSSIDPSRTVEGIPGMLTNRVASHFDLSRPRTVILSGLLKNDESTSREGLLGLSALPILGPLFGSREWKENRTELVIFVRPAIVKDGES